MVVFLGSDEGVVVAGETGRLIGSLAGFAGKRTVYHKLDETAVLVDQIRILKRRYCSKLTRRTGGSSKPADGKAKLCAAHAGDVDC